MNSIKMRGVAAAVAGALMFGFGANAMADSTDDILNALIAKGVLTEEEGALLLKGRTGEKEAADKKKASSVSAKYKDGLSFESGDGSFKAQINGRVHTDYRSFDFNDDQTNAAPSNTGNSISNVTSLASETFDLRRARLGFKATYKEYYDVCDDHHLGLKFLQLAKSAYFLIFFISAFPLCRCHLVMLNNFADFFIFIILL
jgi:phosphate-selective porin OprO/OprP